MSISNRPPAHGDIREVNLPVQVLFEWSDKIPNGDVGYRSGFIMRVLGIETFEFTGQETISVLNPLKLKK